MAYDLILLCQGGGIWDNDRVELFSCESGDKVAKVEKPRVVGGMRAQSGPQSDRGVVSRNMSSFIHKLRPENL